MNHPHLNPDENPANALYRLLQLLPANPTEFGLNEAQLCEAICFQARREHQIVRASQTMLQTLLPALPGAPRHANLFHVNMLLQTEADITNAMAEIYAVMVENFFARFPHLPRYPSLMPAPLAPGHAMASMPGPWPFVPASAQPATPGAPTATSTATQASAATHTGRQAGTENMARLLAEYDKHYYFPLGRLLQQLPGDISNQPRLSPEQGQMCLAASGFAAQAVASIQGGMNALETHFGKAIGSVSSVPEIKRFVDYLQAECEFMQTCEEEYRDAAQHVVRVV